MFARSLLSVAVLMAGFGPAAAQPPSSGVISVCGEFLFDHGDYLRLNCKDPKSQKRLFLLTSKQVQVNIHAWQGKRLRLVVERIPACSRRNSLEFSCWVSPDGYGYWIHDVISVE